MKSLKLISIYLNALHHAEFGQFIDRLVNDFTKAKFQSNTDTHFHNLLEQMKTKMPTYNKALVQIAENENTKKIAELDKERDTDLQALKNSIKPYRYAKKDNQKQAYHTLKIIFDEYKKVETLSYEEETKKINSLLLVLKKPDHKPHISALKIEEFIEELEKSNTAFDTLFGVRSAQNIGKETYETKTLRKELSELYRKFATYTLTMAEVKGEEFYTNALEIINNSRKYYADTLAKRSGVSKGKKEEKTGEKKQE